MKTKAFQTLLKIWITVASVAAFLFGWIVLGHSGKPAASSASIDTSTTGSTDTTTSSQLSALPTLPPLPTLSPNNSANSSTLKALPQTQSQAPSTSFLPRMRTRGS
jgi:hypothetical protein